MFRRWVVAFLASCLAFAAAAWGISLQKGDQPPSHRVQPGNLVVVGMPGLTWSDINPETTPTLWKMAHQGAVGNQLVRTISPHSCSAAAWVTLGAGARSILGYGPPAAPASGTNNYCPNSATGEVNPETGTYVFPQWKAWSKSAVRRNIPSRMGLVASTLEREGQCVAAVGTEAALGAANEQGRVSHFFPSVSSAHLDTCPVTFVGLDRNDAQLGQLVKKAPANTTFVVTGLTDDERPESPRAIVLTGPTIHSGILRSRSTRQPGLVQTTDLSAFILERTAHPPVLGEGRPISVENRSTGYALRSVTNEQVLLRTQHNLITPFFTWYGGAIIAAILAGLIMWSSSRRDPSWAKLHAVNRRWWSACSGLAAAIPASTFLANLLPWYEHEHALVRLWAATLAFAVPITAAAFLGPWRRWTPGPTLFLAAMTALTLAMDVVQGSPLQLVSMLGLQPVYGGRFFGQGNVGFSLMMTSVVLCAALLAGRYRAMKRPRLAMLTALAILVPAIAVEAGPQWGNDGGGTAAFVPALVYLVLRARGMKTTLWRLALAAVAGGLLGLFVAWLDYLRGPDNRTHLGDVFAGLVGEGQINPFKRILYANYHMLTSSPMMLLVPVLLAAAIAVVALPNSVGRPLKPLFVRIPMLRHGLIAVCLVWAFGFVANDSGTSIPATGSMIAVPLIVLLAARMASPKTHEGPTIPTVGRLDS